MLVFLVLITATSVSCSRHQIIKSILCAYIHYSTCKCKVFRTLCQKRNDYQAVSYDKLLSIYDKNSVFLNFMEMKFYFILINGAFFYFEKLELHIETKIIKILSILDINIFKQRKVHLDIMEWM